MTTDSRVRSGLVVGALSLGLLIGVLLGFVLDQGTNPESTPRGPSADTTGPTTEENGVPVGYARTEEGAVAAATNFNLLAGNDALLDRESMVAAMQTMAAPAWKVEAARQATSGYDYIVNTYGSNADVSAAVVRYQVVDFTSDEASVRLWTVSLASGSKRPQVEEVWAVVTIDLIWSENDWRVDGIESSVGPAPVDLPSGQPGESATTLMEEFDEFRGAPVP
jgi:hypothetical protein